MKAPTQELVRGRLREFIADLQAGDQLPSERVLCAEWGVARMTLRGAVEALVAEGLLVRRHGSGTYVAFRPVLRLLGLTSFSHDMRDGKATAVRDAHVQSPDAGFLHHVAGAGPEIDRWSALPIVADFDVPPADAAPPACAERLENRFLGGPAARVMLRRRFATAAILDFVIRVDARDAADRRVGPGAPHVACADAQRVLEEMPVARSICHNYNFSTKLSKSSTLPKSR